MAISAPHAGARRLPTPTIAATGAIAALATAMLTARWGHNGYDLDYALIWGHELAHGHVPSLAGTYAPTPHPGANAVAAALAPLGPIGAADASLALVGLSLAWTAGATWRIGRAMFGPAAGALAALIVVSRPSIVGSALRGSVDLPALALALTAVLVLLGERRRWRAALGLLAVAGFLRPETWLLSLAVLAWQWRETGRWEASSVVLALSAPLGWMLVDLALTGDPLLSLHSTRGLADELGRPRSATLAPLLIPSLLAAIMDAPVLLAATIGLAVFSTSQPRHFTVVFGVLGITLAAFIVLGIAGLPLLARYLLPPAALLMILAAGTVLSGDRDHRPWRGGLPAAAAGLALVVALPATARGVHDVIADSRERHALTAQLRALAAEPAFEQTVRTCGPVTVAVYRLVPAVARATGLAPARIAVGLAGGTLILPRSGRAAESLISASDAEPPVVGPPTGFRIDAGTHNPDWTIATSCPG